MRGARILSCERQRSLHDKMFGGGEPALEGERRRKEETERGRKKSLYGLGKNERKSLGIGTRGGGKGDGGRTARGRDRQKVK